MLSKRFSVVILLFTAVQIKNLVMMLVEENVKNDTSLDSFIGVILFSYLIKHHHIAEFFLPLIMHYIFCIYICIFWLNSLLCFLSVFLSVKVQPVLDC